MSKLHVDIDGSPTEITMTREFDAPRRLVLKAFTTPALLEKWLGGKRAVITEVRTDFRVGGTYKQAFKTHDGFEFFFEGTFLEITDERIVHTERFNGDPNAEARITMTLVEHAPGKTTMTLVMALPTKEARDAIVATGMSEGAGESYDELEKLLASL